jgi:hypothetical protein
VTPRRLVALLVLAGVGCTPEPAPVTLPPVRPPPLAPPPASDLSGGKWGEFHSLRFDVSLPLPDGTGWRIDDRSTPWLRSLHKESASTLLVRTWHEGDVVNRDRCEERARSWAKLPAREGADIVRKEPIDVPPGFDTVVELGVLPTKPGAPLDAFALAFGGWAHRCFAYVYTTTASGPDAERVIGSRLAVMVDGSLGKLRLESDLDPHIPREPRP